MKSTIQLFLFVSITILFTACKNSKEEKSENISIKTSEETVKNELVAIDILLDPDSKMLDTSKTYNNRMLENYPEGFELDESHRPHITIIQAFVKKEDIPKIEIDLKNILRESNLSKTELIANGLYYIPYEDKGLAGITIEKDNLMMFQSQIVEMMKNYTVPNGTGTAFVPRPDDEPIMQATVDYVNSFVPNSSGEKYNPHVTIGTAYEDYVKKLKAAPFEEFTFKIKSVSIYQLGELGTAQKKLVSLEF
ncbi:hypothetical protein [Algoriphagus sp.]|uniref:hypothetical protein n=1 Tax=Algoriphagus sp. TaxID=1872435 RepID=UPI0025FC86E1|nr:hypothetical protein [Algoriphagus sp.]